VRGAALVLALAAAPAFAQPKSGFEFQGADVRSMQQDDFANPGMLWVERGAKLWAQPAGKAGQSCAGCHASIKGAAARYPQMDRGRLLTLEGRIQQSRTERQGGPAFGYESEDLLAITAYVAHQSRGTPIKVSVEGAARKHFDAGRALYYRRVGQLNLACAQCHEQNWGKTLLSERISQGHPNAYPIYRLEWQAVGSLERRLRSCLSGVRAEVLPYGAPEYADLALFLAWRAQGLAVETPGVRR
jgi:sulfur-oxidizing protein SoxA